MEMTSHLTSKASPIVIVGAGVFGISTALHLAENGYSNVKILDKQAYDDSQYSYDKGCDAASADINKIIRAAYGSQTHHQELALDAITHWKRWNTEIQTGQNLPPGFTTSDKLFVNNGNLSMTLSPELSQFEKDTIQNMAKVGRANTQIVLTDPTDVDRAKASGFDFAINPFNRQDNFGILDIQAGFVYADKACRFVLHKAQSLGVQTVLGGAKGTFAGFVQDTTSKITGVRTADGIVHGAEMTIMACGGWTPTLVPQLDNLCETTAGSVCVFQLPKGSPLWDRLAPENFPTWTYNIFAGEKGGLYGFARDPNGAVKIGYRGTKFTNPQTQADGAARSIPTTRWTPQPTRKIPATAANVIKDFVQKFLPELIPYETKTRLCWYTDSFDNHFVIDFVPGYKGLMVATGGSGHGFKFLPTLGKHVVDLLEGRSNDYLHYWKWRSPEASQKPYNSIMEGIASERSLHVQLLTAEDSLTVRQSHL
uniref:FAD dependent oxidoreductase domain-containing protein n=2 Tax=Bionectria ochroleuca TaxID=29856 RepID=A0A0B7JQC7_BIOOC